MTTLNKTNFFQKFQQILEQYYLKPLDGSVKNNLKDGFIERPIHGATHAGRAASWALVMHNYLQKISPDFVNGSMAKIAQQLNIETEELLLLILITMVCHDAARKGEGEDLWEAESAQITKDVLLELGLNENHAKLFSGAIEFKDKPQKYSCLLKELGINSQDYNAFGYIRSIINLGDNLDLPRCVGDFKSQFIFDTLKHIDGFDESLHAKDIMELLKETHQIIYDQGDMLFSCTIKNTSGGTYVGHKARISIKEKASYEHADNVLAALFEDLAKNSKIKPLLTGLDAPKAQKYTGETTFEPFIHGTNSSILSILPKSNFEIMSPLEMMETHHAAPMTGELTRGGYSSIAAKGIGKTSFAKISAQGSQSYTLDKVLSNYTNLEVGLTNKNIENFKRACDIGFKQSYLNINLILIYFVRARQSHESLEEVISAEDLALLFKKIDGSIQFYYFIQLFGAYIFPNVNELNKFMIFDGSHFPKSTKEADDIHLAADNYLTYENIVQKIMDNNIDMKEILNNPTQENLNKVLNILEVPKKCTLMNWHGKVENDVELPLTQFFSLEINAFEYAKKGSRDRDLFSQMQAQMDGGNGINKLLANFISGYGTNELFSSLGVGANKHLEALEKRIQLFKDLINTPQTQFKITAVQEYFLERKFPIVLLSEAEESIALIDFTTEEYRSNSNLKFGTDIKIIATDTNFHRLEILKYLELHKISNVQVILFSDLQKIKDNHKKPVSPQHHSDGVPTLKWMVAKQVPTHVAQSVKAKPSLFSSKVTKKPKLYSEENTREVSNLLNDAKTYQDIQFEPCCAFRCASPSHHTAIELLVKTGAKPSEFQFLIGYAAKDNIFLPKIIEYLADLNLLELYKTVFENEEFRQVLALFSKANIKEGITKELLTDTAFINLIYTRRYLSSSDCLPSIITLYGYDKNLLNDVTLRSISYDTQLQKLINYFEKNNLKQYYDTLLNSKGIYFELESGINKGIISNEMISSIFDDKNIMQALIKSHISCYSDTKEIEVGFILSKLGIEIDFKVGYSITEVINLLHNQGFTDKSCYLKVIKSKETINALLNNGIKTLHQINAVLKAYEFNILSTESARISKYPQLSRMLAFANNKNEWDLYSKFFALLEELNVQKCSFKASSNMIPYDVTSALIDDINFTIDNCFSWANNYPDKMKWFSVECNKLIELSRAVLETNAGFLGYVDSALFGASYLNPISYFVQKPNTQSYSFFKNDSAVLLANMKETLGKMETESSNGKNHFA